MSKDPVEFDRQFEVERKQAEKDAEWMQLNEDGSTTQILQYPITVGKGDKKRQIKEIRYNRPCTGDLEAGDRVEGAHTKMIKMAASMSDTVEGVIRRLDVDDMTRMANHLTKMVGGTDSKNSQTGDGSSPT